MSELKQPKNEAIYTLQEYQIDYIKGTATGVKTATISDKGIFEHANFNRVYSSEYDAIVDLCDTVLPTSFYPYLEKMMGRAATWDAVNNVIFIGNPNGRWDERIKRYRNARELGMEAVDDYELSLVEAVQSSIEALRTFVK